MAVDEKAKAVGEEKILKICFYFSSFTDIKHSDYQQCNKDYKKYYLRAGSAKIQSTFCG
jgi:hypothetical protein